jgi:hypothetical protein
MTENTKQILFSVVQDQKSFFSKLKTLMSVGGLLYTTETELDKKWDFYKAIYRKYVTNDF